MRRRSRRQLVYIVYTNNGSYASIYSGRNSVYYCLLLCTYTLYVRHCRKAYKLYYYGHNNIRHIEAYNNEENKLYYTVYIRRPRNFHCSRIRINYIIIFVRYNRFN